MSVAKPSPLVTMLLMQLGLKIILQIYSAQFALFSIEDS